MFKALRTPRRIILSGTPIQNDLSEFHAMVCFLWRDFWHRIRDNVISRLTSVTPVSLVAIALYSYSTVELAVPNPDDYPTFRRVYEVPILKSRAPDRTGKELEIGEARSTQVCLLQCTRRPVLRIPISCQLLRRALCYGVRQQF